MAQERFGLYGETGHFQVANAEELPLPDSSFDHVYSFGVLMASPNPQRIVDQIYRVLRPGGTVTVMVYNKTSINYYVEIMFLRKILRQLLRPSFMPKLIARVTGLDRAKLDRHRELLRAKTRLTKQEWLNLKTDGTRLSALRRLHRRRGTGTLRRLRERSDRSLVLRPHTLAVHWTRHAAQDREMLGRRFGWHRMVYANKPA